MNFTYSTLGEKLTGHSGIVELMDDLGHALADAGDRPMHMMGGGNPAHIPGVQVRWRERLTEILADEAFCDRMLANYDPPAGNTRFRQAVASCLTREFGWPVTAENIAVTSGGQAAFFYLFNLLAGERAAGFGRILLPLVPEYIGYADQGVAASMFTARRPRIEETGDRQFKYRVDFDALEIGDDIAAICVTRPTNPSGNVLTDEEIDRLRQIARQRHIPLIVDNAYGIPFPGAVFTDIRPAWDPGMILTFSLSKVGLPGVRTGIVVADEPLVRRLASMTAIIGLANGNVGQSLVRPMLESGELVELSRNVIRPYYEQRSRRAASLVREAFRDDFPFAIHRSEGAFFLWLWFPELPITSRELYERLKARGVLVVPGEYFFYGLDDQEPWPHAKQCVRMTFSQAHETIAAGVAIMADELRRLHADATRRAGDRSHLALRDAIHLAERDDYTGMTMAKVTDAVEILKRKTGIDPDSDAEMLKISEDFRVAQMIYDARTEAGRTQQELAKAVGTTQSVISQLESAEYKGHSLAMLERIARALHRRVEVRLVPIQADDAQ